MLKKLSSEAHSFGSVIKKYREMAKLSQVELASMIGVNRNSVFNWENDKNKPDFDIIRRMCPALHMPIQELFNTYDTPDQLTDDESVLISNYRALLPRTQQIVLHSIKAAAEEDHRQWVQELRRSHYVMAIENTSAAAGVGCLYSDVREVDRRFVKVSRLSSRADTLVRVSGRSMEPVYHDGDILFVTNAETGNTGDDLICTTADGLVVKRMNADRQLYSVNPDFPFGTKTEDDHVRIIGRVIGVAGEDDFADGDMVAVLEDVMSDEVEEFGRERNWY